MRNQCECKLPYVINGTDTCYYCGNQQPRFLPIKKEKPISVKRDFNGSEFQRNDIVEVVGKLYCCLVEIQNYLERGWYRVKLPSGGFHETQILGDKVG